MIDHSDDLKKLKNYGSETDLVKIIQEIRDTIYFRRYDQKQIPDLVNEIMKTDLLSVKYETREEILFLMIEASSHYDISGCVNLKSLVEIKEKLEDDLKEYVDSIIEIIE